MRWPFVLRRTLDAHDAEAKEKRRHGVMKRKGETCSECGYPGEPESTSSEASATRPTFVVAHSQRPWNARVELADTGEVVPGVRSFIVEYVDGRPELVLRIAAPYFQQHICLGAPLASDAEGA